MTHKHSSTASEKALNRSPFDSFFNDNNFALMMLIVTTDFYLFTMMCFVKSSGKSGRVILSDTMSEKPIIRVPTSAGAC